MKIFSFSASRFGWVKKLLSCDGVSWKWFYEFSFLPIILKFQNRRAKYRKQEKQLQKALAPSVLPSCNGMMRNIQGYSVSRGYQPYPHPNSINRYPQVINLLPNILWNFVELLLFSLNFSGPIPDGLVSLSNYDATIFDVTRLHGFRRGSTRLHE